MSSSSIRPRQLSVTESAARSRLVHGMSHGGFFVLSREGGAGASHRKGQYRSGVDKESRRLRGKLQRTSRCDRRQGTGRRPGKIIEAPTGFAAARKYQRRPPILDYARFISRVSILPQRRHSKFSECGCVGYMRMLHFGQGGLRFSSILRSIAIPGTSRQIP